MKSHAQLACDALHQVDAWVGDFRVFEAGDRSPGNTYAVGKLELTQPAPQLAEDRKVGGYDINSGHYETLSSALGHGKAATV